MIVITIDNLSDFANTFTENATSLIGYETSRSNRVRPQREKP